MKLLIVWLLNALALIAVAYFVPNIHVANFTTALIAALVIGLVNMLIKPISNTDVTYYYINLRAFYSCD